MKKRALNKSIKIFKYSWIIAGILLLLWTLYFFIKTQTIKGLGFSAGALLFAAGLYGFLIYVIITMILILIQEIIKRMNKA